MTKNISNTYTNLQICLFQTVVKIIIADTLSNHCVALDRPGTEERFGRQEQAVAENTCNKHELSELIALQSSDIFADKLMELFNTYVSFVTKRYFFGVRNIHTFSLDVCTLFIVRYALCVHFCYYK